MCGLYGRTQRDTVIATDEVADWRPWAIGATRGEIGEL